MMGLTSTVAAAAAANAAAAAVARFVYLIISIIQSDRVTTEHTGQPEEEIPDASNENAR